MGVLDFQIKNRMSRVVESFTENSQRLIMALLQCLIGILLFYECNAVIDGKLLNRSVSSAQILQKDDNNNCYFPPLCRLNISKCNIPKIALNDLSFDDFYNEYFVPKRPVMIQLCPNPSSKCDLSQIIDNSTNLFEWHKILSIIYSKQEYEDLIHLELNGTPKDRANTIDIHPLKDRQPKKYKDIIDRIHPPSMFEKIDIFNDLNGFLTTSDNAMMSNKWIIIGTAGGGAKYHFDYFLSSFWNMVVEGSKYWILTEPFDTLKIWNHSDERIKEAMNLSINEFFDKIVLSGFLKKEFERIGEGKTYFECIQNVGDIVYAPPIYYHSTVNLERTLSVSRNMITREESMQSFNFMTRDISLRSRDGENKLVGLYQTMDLCCALYKFDASLFQNSPCWNRDFLDRLNNFNDVIHGDKKYVTDYFKYHEKYHSKLYIDMCNYAKEHAQMSSFRR